MEQWDGEEYFQKLYLDTKREIHCYIALLLHDYGAAEDVTQEVYLEAYRKWDVLRQHPEPKGFLYRVARYKAWHWIRYHSRIEKKELLCDDSILEREEGKTDRFDELHIHLTLKHLLSPDEYQLFCAYYIQGYTSSEIAAYKAKTDTAIRMNCSRMMRKLGKLVKM